MELWRAVPRNSKYSITCLYHPLRIARLAQCRGISTNPITGGSRREESKRPSVSQTKEGNKFQQLPPLSVMPTGILLRTLMVTYILSSPRLVSLSLPIMDRISNSNSWFLNPDRNPILHAIIRKMFYDHFAAGENETEIRRTMMTMKRMGFEGVILGYGRETLVDHDNCSRASDVMEKCIKEWKDGTLRTLAMLGKGDFLALKFTGAGPESTEALAKGKPPSPAMSEAIAEICDQASKQATRIWVDAEQQVFQPGIDSWTTDMMRKYNRNGNTLIYNTFQAYLKGTPKNISYHMKLAQDEGWALGIKLVRGAYIASEQRHLIHDTIEETHAAYNSIVQSLLTKSFPGIEGEFPIVQLMLASHNSESVKRGYETWKSRSEQGLPTIKLELGQLQGMADELSCGLVQIRQQMAISESMNTNSSLYPRAFKCLCWGRTQECTQFLMRRVTENRGSLDRTRLWMVGLKDELRRRIKLSMKFS
ncbi:proline oxidase Put1 [Bisporella sp. PMI_857]|nr:proline oxidase Put1 [Bisporella sp. PMI_857]